MKAKRLRYLWIALSLLWISGYVSAQEMQQITVHVEKAGTLGNSIAISKAPLITNLKIIGNINAHDCNYLRVMMGGFSFGTPVEVKAGNLSVLDLSEAKIEDNSFDFWACKKIETVILPPEVQKAYFNDCPNLKYVNADNLTKFSFKNCISLETICLSKATSVAQEAFLNCESLERVTLMEATSLDQDAFCNCKSLKYIHIENASEWVSSWAFFLCDSLETVSIGKGTIAYELGSAFYSPSLKEFIVDSDNPVYCSEDGILYSKDKTELLRCPTTKTGTFILNDNVVQIGSSAFSNCRRITSFRAGKSLERMEGGFYGCDSLTSVYLGDRLNYMAGSLSFAQATFPETVKDVHIDVITPPAINGTSIISNNNEATLYVPKGSYNAYWLALGWGDFKTIKETGVEDPTSNETVTSMDGIECSVYENRIIFHTNQVEAIQVYTLSGQILFDQCVHGYKEITLPKGLYVVKAGNQTAKVRVK